MPTSRRTLALGLAAALTCGLTACTVTIEPPDPGVTDVAPGSGMPTIDEIVAGAPMEWDVTAAIPSPSVGLGTTMAVVSRADGELIPVTLETPAGSWSAQAEQVSVTPRDGRVDTVNVFVEVNGGDAARDELIAAADVLGFSVEEIERWRSELASALEPSRAGEPRVRTGLRGSSGHLATSVQISHAPGPGGDESIRLWYAVDADEARAPEPSTSATGQ
ncbi:hypothetical protein JNB62_14155 [Microbacterium jejuense]|uniref:Lipoprotein n=1 Tax=Microbacterium jejuense TaxID=1263637 RepID=A0ABS7HPD9_9MICO|nr:hypothetical protein [Microbacterium jejuense]MBW9094832.1 hypothetical protein [Microbacterium jejuense]